MNETSNGFRRTPQGRSEASPDKWRAFWAIALTFVTIVFSSTMAFLVLPSIADEFGVTLRAVGWVVIIESLIVGALLLPFGGLADAIGRKRVLLAGMVIFGCGSVFAGLAPSFAVLIAARMVMALGNALVQSIGTGLLVAAFPAEERGLALGAQTTAVAVGSSSGPFLTGLALDVWSWQSLFLWLAVPSALSVVAIAVLISPDQEPATSERFDRIGGMLSALMITLIVVTINNPFDLSWLSPIVLGSAAASTALVVAFVRWELQQQNPMLELRLFALRDFRSAVVVRIVGFLGSTVVTFLLPIYLLGIRQISGRQAGFIISLAAVGLGTSAQVSGRLSDKLGPRVPAVGGLILQIAVSLALAFAGETTSLWVLAPIALISGFGVGSWNVPGNSAMMGAAPLDSIGVVGAFTNVTRTLGNVLGQALAAAVVVAVMSSQGFDIPLGELDETVGAGGAFLDGWRVAFFIAAAFSTLALAAATRLPAVQSRHGKD